MALLALTQLAHATTPPSDNHTSFKSKADTYARMAGLPTLTPGAGLEIRVWSYDHIGGGVGATIVSKGHIRKFSKDATFRDGKIELEPARMSSPIPVADTQDLEALLAKLEPLNGTTVSCPMLDGGNLLIDAVLDGRSIRISADNPWACTDKNARAVMQLVYALSDDLATLCLTSEEVTNPTPWFTGFWLSKARQNDEGEDEVLVFRHDGTLVFYFSDYDPYYTGPASRYTVSGNAIHIKDNRPYAEHAHMTLHASRDRSRLVLQDPKTKKRVIFVRMAGKRCINPRELADN